MMDIIEIITKVATMLTAITSLVMPILAYLKRKAPLGQEATEPLPPVQESSAHPLPLGTETLDKSELIVDLVKAYRSRVNRFEAITTILPFLFLFLVIYSVTKFKIVGGFAWEWITYAAGQMGVLNDMAAVSIGMLLLAMVVIGYVFSFVAIKKLVAAGAVELRNRIAACHFSALEKRALASKLRPSWWRARTAVEKEILAIVAMLEHSP